MWRLVVGLLLGGLIVVGCGTAGPPTEHLAVQHEQLAMVASAPFDLEAKTEYQRASNKDAQLACGTTQCLVAYTQFVVNDYVAFASRVGLDGAPLDVPRIQLGKADPNYGLTQVVARGDEFLVLWHSQSGTKVSRIRGAAGAVDDVTSKVGAGSIEGGSSDDGYVFVYTNPLRARVYDPSLNLISEVALGGGNVGEALVATGDHQYLITWTGSGQRVDSQTGALLDASPIEYSHYKLGFPSVGYVDGIYQLGWVWQGDILGSRIRASDGAVLDPDDTFNQQSGAKLLCAKCSLSQSQANVYGDLRISALGTKALFVWSHNPSNSPFWFLYGAQVDPTTGLRVDGKTDAAEASTTTKADAFDLGLTQGNGVLLRRANPEDGLGSFKTTTGPLAFQVDGAYPPAIYTPTHSQPAVASNGTSFFVAWSADGHIRGSRIDGTSGEPLDDPALDFGAGDTPAVAAAGNDYLVAWIAPTTYQLQRRMVSGTDGAPAAALPAIDSRYFYETGTDAYQTRALRLVYNGDKFCLAWLYQLKVRAVRLDATGAALDAGFVQLLTSSYNSYGLMADTSPTPDMRTFVAVATLATSGNYQTSTVNVRRFRAQSGALIDPITLGAHGRLMFGAASADEMVISYRGLPDDASQVLTTVQAGDGSVAAALQTLDLAGTTVFGDELWYDGVSFVQLMKKDLNLYVRRYSSELAPLEGATPAVGSPLSSTFFMDYYDHAVAGNGKGRSLLALQQLDIARTGVVLKGLFLDNDGEPAPIENASGSGGAGGDAGSSGASNAGSPGGAGNGGLSSEGGAPAGMAGAGPSMGGAAPETGGSASSGQPGQGAATGTSPGGTGGGSSAPLAGAGNDAAGPSSGSNSDSGCGCRMATSPTGGPSLVLGLLVMGFSAMRRRRRRADRPSLPRF